MSQLEHSADVLRLQYQGFEELNDPDNKAKLCILLWYFYGCLKEIYTRLLATSDMSYTAGRNNIREDIKVSFREHKETCTKKARAWQRKSEKAMVTIGKQAYSDEFEIVDRLAFLGIELGLVTKEALSQPTSCVYQARRRILEKAATKDLNPGMIKSMSQNGTTRLSTQAPWELTCLSHHSRAVAALWSETEIDAEDIQRSRNDTNRFFTANFMFVGSWNQSKGSATWWDLDTTCVIQSTHLDLRLRANRESEERPEKDTLAVMRSPSKLPAAMSPLQLAEELDAPKSKVDSRVKKEVPEDGILELLKRQFEQQIQTLQSLKPESEVAVDYDWTLSEPRALSHPKEWVESLDDTPELFKSCQTKAVGLRQRLLKYLTDRLKEEMKHNSLTRGPIDIEIAIEKVILQPSWSKKTIAQNFDIQDLSYLTVVNIEVHSDDETGANFCGRLQIPRSIGHKKGRYSRQSITEKKYVKLPFYKPNENPKEHTLDAYELARGIWLAYLDGNIDRGAKTISNLSGHSQEKFDGLSPDERAVLLDEKIRDKVLEQYKHDLLRILNDSVRTSSILTPSWSNLCFLAC